MSKREIITIIMFVMLIQGIFEFKNFLSFNFINNETQLKTLFNEVLNGNFPEVPKKPESNN